MRAIYEVVLKKPFLYINSLTNACDSKLHVGRSYEEVVRMTDVVCDSCQTNMYQLQELLNRWIFVKDNVWKVYLNDHAVKDFSSPKLLPIVLKSSLKWEQVLLLDQCSLWDTNCILLPLL